MAQMVKAAGQRQHWKEAIVMFDKMQEEVTLDYVFFLTTHVTDNRRVRTTVSFIAIPRVVVSSSTANVAVLPLIMLLCVAPSIAAPDPFSVR